MLILTQREQSEIVIAGLIRVRLVRCRGRSAQIGIQAPDGLPVHRARVLEQQDDLLAEHAAAGRALAQLAEQLQDSRPEDDLPAVGAPAAVDLPGAGISRIVDHLDQAAELAEMLGRDQNAAALQEAQADLQAGRPAARPAAQRAALLAMATQLDDPELRDTHCGWMPSDPAEVARTLRGLAGLLPEGLPQ